MTVEKVLSTPYAKDAVWDAATNHDIRVFGVTALDQGDGMWLVRVVLAEGGVFVFPEEDVEEVAA